MGAPLPLPPPCNTPTCAGLGVSGNDLGCAWEDLASRGIDPPSWQIARRLYHDGTAAIIVPSYAPGANEDDINVVFWRWSDRKPHRVQIIDDQGRLPHNDASWR